MDNTLLTHAINPCYWHNLLTHLFATLPVHRIHEKSAKHTVSRPSSGRPPFFTHNEGAGWRSFQFSFRECLWRRGHKWSAYRCGLGKTIRPDISFRYSSLHTLSPTLAEHSWYIMTIRYRYPYISDLLLHLSITSSISVYLYIVSWIINIIRVIEWN